MRSIFILLLLAVRAFGGLTFERVVIESSVLPDSGVVESIFKFRNSGTTPVQILHIAASCGCTTARSAKDKFAPGESGEIIARFDIGERLGQQEKTVTVFTDDPTNPRQALTLKVLIEPMVDFDRTVLLWQKGEPARPITIQLDVIRKAPLRIESVDSANPLFRTALRTVEEGRRYAITVTPTNVENPESSLILVRSVEPADKPHTFTLRARIK